MEGEQIVGIVNILHDQPCDWIGHLGYSIRPEERRKGKGAVLLNLALEYCYKLGIERVMVCPAERNTQSRRLLEKGGGVYQETIEIKRERYRRYLSN